MKRRFATALIPVCVSALVISCTNSGTDNTTDKGNSPASNVASLGYSIGGTLPHDTSYFTEGIQFLNNDILESTGLPGKSKLVEYDPQTGKPVHQVNLESKFFGEGVTILHDTI